MVTWRESAKSGWPVVVLSDPFTVIECREALKHVCERYPPRCPVQLLIDCRFCSAPSADFIGRAVTILERHQECCRVAVVVQSDDSYEMGRFAEALVDIRKVAIDVQTFREWDTAEAWIEGRAPSPTTWHAPC